MLFASREYHRPASIIGSREVTRTDVLGVSEVPASEQKSVQLLASCGPGELLLWQVIRVEMF